MGENECSNLTEGIDSNFVENTIEISKNETVSNDTNIENLSETNNYSLNYNIVACEKWDHILNTDIDKLKVEGIETNENSVEIIKVNNDDIESQNNDKIVENENVD